MTVNIIMGKKKESRQKKIAALAKRYNASLEGEVLTVPYSDGNFDENIIINLEKIPAKFWKELVVKSIVKHFYNKGLQDA